MAVGSSSVNAVPMICMLAGRTSEGRVRRFPPSTSFALSRLLGGSEGGRHLRESDPSPNWGNGSDPEEKELSVVLAAANVDSGPSLMMS